MVRRLKLKGID
ncbi:hypothetical protein Patl1_34648 [Pistacia atlantica]|nr:hypothetical protein Patl1_34648 [Pistacia atlantica]